MNAEISAHWQKGFVVSISRRIILLICVALMVCGAIFSVASYGLQTAATEISNLDGKVGLTEAKSLLQLISSVQIALYIMLILGGVLIGVGGYLLLRGIVKPLHEIESAIYITHKELDLTSIIDLGIDSEINRVAIAYNQLLIHLRGHFVEINQALAKLQDATEEVDHSSRKITRNSLLQSDASTNVAAAVEEMSVSISVVAEQASQASRYTDESHAVAQRSAEIIISTVSGIQQIAGSIGDASGLIKALRIDCDSISSMANMIRDIADQTNLLALNAAIEAARAGEQGRGFAVVADEVRKLAERTTHSTQEISSLVSRMQESAHAAEAAMNSTEKAVNEEVVNSRSAGSSIEKIRTNTQTAANSVTEIFCAMREQETVSSSIARNIEQIAQIGEQNAASAHVSAAGIGHINQAWQQISGIISSYRIDTGPQKITLRAAFPNSDEHPCVRAVRAMADMLNERTGGRITLKVFSGGSFGVEKEIIDQVKAGLIDIGRCNVALLAKEIPLASVTSLPYLFDSMEHMRKAIDGAPGKMILDSCSQAGYIGLSIYEPGLRSIYSNTPVRSLSDMRGMKIRIMESDIWAAIASAMGGIPVPTGQDQVTAAMRSGLIDCAENSLVVFDDYKHYETFKYYNQTEHAIVAGLVLFSKKRWDTLSAEDQSLIRETSLAIGPLARRFLQEQEDVARKKAIAAGVTFISNIDKNPFRDAMQSIYANFATSTQQKSLIKAIRSIR